MGLGLIHVDQRSPSAAGGREFIGNMVRRAAPQRSSTPPVRSMAVA
jgi:hypothetical protein